MEDWLIEFDNGSWIPIFQKPLSNAICIICSICNPETIPESLFKTLFPNTKEDIVKRTDVEKALDFLKYDGYVFEWLNDTVYLNGRIHRGIRRNIVKYAIGIEVLKLFSTKVSYVLHSMQTHKDFEQVKQCFNAFYRYIDKNKLNLNQTNNYYINSNKSLK